MTSVKSDTRPFIILSSNTHSGQHLLAYGAEDCFRENISSNGMFGRLQDYLDKDRKWVLGYFTYDLKNTVENLESANQDHLGFPEVFFFRPKVLKKFASHEELEKYVFEHFGPKLDNSNVLLKARTNKEDYIENVRSIIDHIQRGDIYEMNYCVEFYAENVKIDPMTRFLRLNDFNSAPFSCYFSLEGLHLMCGSPERFMVSRGNKVISQPIKGTIKRGSTEKEDEKLKQQLLNDPKERSENIMITDLVRNDLSRSAKRGTVKVSELCGLYSFKTVHQLISTVECEVDEDVSTTQVIENAFPMGSMTGAPKIRAMELIEKFENFKRGIYSGAIGYFNPDRDFDFNVVIRSIMYNENTGYISAPVGGAITSQSNPEREYDECILKVKSLRETLFDGQRV